MSQKKDGSLRSYLIGAVAAIVIAGIGTFAVCRKGDSPPTSERKGLVPSVARGVAQTPGSQDAYSLADAIRERIEKNTVVVKGWKDYIHGYWKADIHGKGQGGVEGLSPGEGYCVILEPGEGVVQMVPTPAGPGTKWRTITLNEGAAGVEMSYIPLSESESLSVIGIAMTRVYNRVAAKHPGWRAFVTKESDWIYARGERGIHFPNEYLTHVFGSDAPAMKVGAGFRLFVKSEKGKIDSYSSSD